jgi:hypothetical protein
MPWKKAVFSRNTQPPYETFPAIKDALIARNELDEASKKDFCAYAPNSSPLTVYFSPVAVSHCGPLLDRLANAGWVVSPCPAPTGEWFGLDVVVGDRADCQDFLKNFSEPGLDTNGI